MPDEFKPERVDHIMQFFACEHLPEDLRAIAQPFGKVASWLVQTVPQNPERTVALRKLLEAKDAAVRAQLAKAAPLPARAVGPGKADAYVRQAFDVLWSRWMDGDAQLSPREILSTLRKAQQEGERQDG